MGGCLGPWRARAGWDPEVRWRSGLALFEGSLGALPSQRPERSLDLETGRPPPMLGDYQMGGGNSKPLSA